MKILVKTFVFWLPVAIIITIIIGFVYVEAQQILRLGANELQVQLITDTAAQLSKGNNIQIGNTKTDIATSLSPFFIAFDENGNPVDSTAELNGKIPSLPQGVFSYAKNRPDHRFTWQPRTSLRYAVVLMHYKGVTSGYIAIGRSLREVEKMIGWATVQAFFAWVIMLGVSFLATGFVVSIQKPLKKLTG